MCSTPILGWNDISYDVSTKDGVRRLLHNVSGSIYPGEVVAIMGASGAGKTTLLNVLSGRIQGGKLFGDIKFNGAKRNPHTFKRMLAYVEQDDLMHSTLTVEETLSISASLRLPNSKYTDQDKKQRVEEVMRQLRLSHIANSRIGGGGGKRGVSGGERKRVSIGIELVTEPSLLVLDEPSSGLDSSSAEMVVQLTKDMAHERNLCTLMTIHQPSAEMVAQFDKLILLSQGKVVYMGPADQALQYFEKLGYPSTNPNPANFYIDLMTIDFSSSAAMKESETRVQSLVDCYAEFNCNGSKLLVNKSSFLESETAEKANNNSSGINIHNSKGAETPSNTNLAPSSSSRRGSVYYESYTSPDKDITNETANIVLHEATPRNSWISETRVLLRRNLLLNQRNRSLIYAALFQSIMMTIFTGFVFFQMKTDQSSVQNRVGIMVVILIQITFPVTFPVMTTIMLNRSILMRERSSSSYRMSSYFVAHALSFVPLTVIPLSAMFTGVYFIAHFQYSAAKYFIALSFLLSMVYSSIGISFTLAMLTDSLDTAYILTPTIMSILYLFAGNFSNASAVTPVLRWIKYICIYYYTYSGFMQNEFRGLEFECDNSTSNCYKTGEDVLSAYGLDEFPIWLNIIIELALGTGLFVIGYIALRWVAKPRYLWL
ncbi:hypothetical protein H4217_004587 [Coemansia sp. RSA 1939]|nr:hypothetical protein H4217_004587 [Coemansia sp. RSA 1939]KAJ2607619.1 hypothetical protein EV177_005412 [Coemansia sp. RSA 1804]